MRRVAFFIRWIVMGCMVVVGAGCLDPEETDASGETEASLLLEDECLPGDVTWPNPGSSSEACTGPWTYNAYPTVVSRHQSCGVDRCLEREMCAQWFVQAPKKPTTQFTRPGLNCRLVVGEGYICDLDFAGAQAACNTFKNEERDEVDAPANQRVTSATVATDVISPQGPNITEHTFKCTATINYEKKITGRWESCDCEVVQYKSCEHATGSPQRRITSPGISLNQVRALHDESTPGQLGDSQISPKCSTAEEISTGSLGAKLDRLLDSLADPQIVTPTSPLYGEFVRRAKITYELFTNANLAAFTRRPEMLGLYREHRELEPACGRNKPATSDACNGDWLLRLCTRLTSMHVKVEQGRGDLIRDLYPECIDQLRELGDEIESAACTADGEFAAASLEAQRGVQEKLMLRLGTRMNRAASATNAVLLADNLHLIDRWYVQAVRTLVDGDRVRTELELISNKFWQVVYGYRLAAQGAEWATNSPYAHLQASLDLAQAETDPNEAIDILRDALSDTDTTGLKLDRDVLAAIYSNVGGQPTMVGGPLLHFTADALAPMVKRLDSLVEFHDLGCSFAQCSNFAVPTKLSRFWRVLAHLDAGPISPVPLEEILSGIPDTMLGWKTTFSAIRTAQQRLLDALAGAGSPDDAREDALRTLLDKSRSRSVAYESTGLFLPPLGDRLYTAVHASQRDQVQARMNSLQSLVAGARAELDDNLMDLVDGLVRVRDADTALAQLQATQERLQLERDDLARRDAALRSLINGVQGPDAVLEELMNQWALVEGSLDEGSYIRLGDDDTIHLDLSAQDARFDGWTGRTIEHFGVQKISVDAGQSISVATDGGTWAASCALRKVQVIDPDAASEGQPGQAIGTNALAGPEGYSIVWSENTFKAESQNEVYSERITAGIRMDTCGGASIPGNSSQVCAYLDASVSYAEEDVWQTGTEQRTSAQFSGGLFVPITPFEAPAGSLVIVEMPPGGTTRSDMRNLHLVHGPHTTIVVNEPADLWVAVNDVLCDEQDGQNRIGVDIGVFTPVGEAAEALLPRIAHTVSLVRQRQPDIMARGEIFPSEMNEIELQAKLDVIGGPGDPQIPVDEYPSPLRDLFLKFLAREMTRLEASVRLVGVEREIAIRDAEYRANREALHNTQMSGYLLSLRPEWVARDLDFKELRKVTAVLGRDLRYYVAPIVRLWYPVVLEELGDLAELQALTAVDLDTPVASLAGWMEAVATQVNLEIEDASFPYPGPEETPPSFVALRFPRPDALDPSCADSPSARCRALGQGSTFRWATVAQTRKLWEALGQPGDPSAVRRLSYELSPDDLYQPTLGTAYLSCIKSLPVVTKLGVAIAGMDPGDFPNEPRSMEGSSPDVTLMAFPDSTGTRYFQMDNGSWDGLANVPLIYGSHDYNAIRSAFTAEPQDVRGLSPFMTFSFEIPEPVVVEWKLRRATTIDLLFELEATRGALPVAVPACVE